MRYTSLSILLFIIGVQYSCSESKGHNVLAGTPKIVIHCSLPENYKEIFSNPDRKDVKNVSVIFWSPLDDINMRPQRSSVDAIQAGNIMNWVFYSEKPVLVNTAFQRSGFIMSPGDSVFIKITSNGITYLGRGAESLKLQYDLSQAFSKLAQPAKFVFKVDSLKDYLSWNDYWNKSLESVMNILNAGPYNISETIFKNIKAKAIYAIEFGRAEAFISFSDHRGKTKEISPIDYLKICDSTLDSPMAKWLRDCDDCSVPTWYFYQYNRIQARRRYGFDVIGDSSMNTDGKRKVVYYNMAKDNYRGLLKERLLQYILADKIVKDLGVSDPLTDSVLKDYYGQPGFSQYKKWMEQYADSMRKKQKYARKGN